MPDFDGTKWPSGPALRLEDRALAGGFDHHLTKPVTGGTIEALLQSAAAGLAAKGTRADTDASQLNSNTHPNEIPARANSTRAAVPRVLRMIASRCYPGPAFGDDSLVFSFLPI
jgi:hypothetical protein